MILLPPARQGRRVQDVRRGGREHQVDVPTDGEGGGAQQGHGAGLQDGRAAEGDQAPARHLRGGGRGDEHCRHVSRG